MPEALLKYTHTNVKVHIYTHKKIDIYTHRGIVFLERFAVK